MEFRILTEAYSPLVGDLDCDGDIDFDDIPAFTLGLFDPQQYEQQMGLPPAVKGDIDGDGDQDYDDISSFVLLIQTACVPIPWLMFALSRFRNRRLRCCCWSVLLVWCRL